MGPTKGKDKILDTTKEKIVWSKEKKKKRKKDCLVLVYFRENY